MLLYIKNLIKILDYKRKDTQIDRASFNADEDYICSIEYFYNSTVVTIREFIDFGTTVVRYSIIQEFGAVITDDLFIEYKENNTNYTHLTMCMENITDDILQDMTSMDLVEFSLCHGRVNLSPEAIKFIPIILEALQKSEKYRG